LEIYKLAYRLAIEVHKMSLTLPEYEILSKKNNKFIEYVENNWISKK